ncbi:glyoxylase I family protein [Alkalibacterium subtropicum]|uniref:Glyoxylase I family protein n=1 Tax=Alkalibacterium subtropicum TaxID=753702 RepID=A0A1I1HZI7_9LACT|nr:VOC family protein [Alkalibacterium subtropicum]SFC27378.1 glyoxylase I family protein [Alkalibacterium subtropicum]
MFTAIHHVAIIASNYDVSRYFYTELLEFPVINEVYREERQSYKCDLKVGESQIELFSFPDPPKRPNSPEAAGLRHLCFGVKNIDETVKKLENRGIDCEDIRVDPYTGKRFTFFKDPDGLPLEVYEG